MCLTYNTFITSGSRPYITYCIHSYAKYDSRLICQVEAKRNQIQNPFLTAQSTQIKSVISVPIKDFIHHYPRALFNDIPRVGAHFYDIPGSGHTFTTYPGRSAVKRHTRVNKNKIKSGLVCAR